MGSTIHDVAVKAGVSTALVSRVLNGKTGVSEKSREKIAAAIRELDYTPNLIARSLVTQRTYSIGVLMELLDSDVSLALLRGLEIGAQAVPGGDKYTLIYTNSFGNAARRIRHLNYLTQGRADGVIVFGSQLYNDELLLRLSKTRFPLVLIENDLKTIEADKVIVDSVGGAYAATEELIRKGHRKIAHIAGDINLKVTMDRMNGYVSAMQQYGIPVDKSMLIIPDYTDLPKDANQPIGYEKIFFNQGYLEMKRMLAKDIVPDALFVPTDFLGFGARKALEEAGLQVPRDVSMIGFDNEISVAARMMVRPITSMMQPLDRAGQEAIRLCVSRIEQPEREMERVVLPTALIDHGTVADRK